MSNSFDSREKFSQRQYILDLARRFYPFRAALMLPSKEAFDVIIGLRDGVFDKSTKFFFAEKCKAVVPFIKQFVADNGLNAAPVIDHSGGIEAVDLTKIIDQPLDAVMLDTCCTPTNKFLAWFGRMFLQFHGQLLDRAPFISFTFCLETPYQEFDLSLAKRLATISPTIDMHLHLDPNDNAVEDMKIISFARMLSRALAALLPGVVDRCEAVVYRSSKLLMMNLSFEIHTDAVVADHKFFAIKKAGIDLSNPEPMIPVKRAQDEKSFTLTPVDLPALAGYRSNLIVVDWDDLSSLIGSNFKSASAFCKKASLSRGSFTVAKRRRSAMQKDTVDRLVKLFGTDSFIVRASA